jgi:hypothetical protein
MATVHVDCPELDCDGRISVDLDTTTTPDPETGGVRVVLTPTPGLADAVAAHVERHGFPHDR